MRVIKVKKEAWRTDTEDMDMHSQYTILCYIFILLPSGFRFPGKDVNKVVRWNMEQGEADLSETG